MRHRSVGSTIRMLFKQIFTNSRVGFAAGEDHLRYKGCRNAERDTKYQSRGENSPRANGDLASLEKQFISLQGVPECTEDPFKKIQTLLLPSSCPKTVRVRSKRKPSLIPFYTNYPFDGHTFAPPLF